MKKRLTLCMAIFLPSILFAQNLNWMKQISGSGFDYLKGMTTDASGNIYVVGGFSGTIDLDPGPATVPRTATGSDVWMAKYTSSGAFIWGNMLSGGGDDFGFDIALDNSGNIYITGYYDGQLPAFDFDPSGASHQPGGTAGFFAKYTNSGTFVWAKTLTGGGTTRINGIAVDASSNIYITGSLFSGLRLILILPEPRKIGVLQMVRYFTLNTIPAVHMFGPRIQGHHQEMNATILL